MITSNFNHLPLAAFQSQVERIIIAMTGNADFPVPWPATVPTLAQIQTDLTAYQAALNATASGDRTRIVERNAARSLVATDLTQLGFYLQVVAQGDDTKLVTSGYPLRRARSGNRTPELPPAPERFLLSRGTVSGMIVVRSGRVPTAGSYEVQTTAADPTVEANWIAAGSYKLCRRIELQGFTPGKVYSVRMRALGTAGPGAWTAAASLMVV